MRRSPYSHTPAPRATALGVVLACTISVGGAMNARGDDVTDQKKQSDARISALGQQLEGTNVNLARAFVNLERTNAAMPAAQAKVAQAQQVLTQSQAAQAQAEATEARAVVAKQKARAHNEAVAQRLAVAQTNQQRATEQLAKSGSELVTSQDDLDAYAAEVFQGGSNDSQLGLVFGSTSPQDFADRVVMADTASNVATDTIDLLATTTADNTSTGSYLTAVRHEIATLKRQSESALKGAQAAAAAATSARAEAVLAKNNAVVATTNASAAKASLDTLKSQQVSFAADLKVQKAGEQQDLASAEAESSRLKGILVERARQARIAEAKRIAKLQAEREAKIRAEAAAAAKKRAAQIRAEQAKVAAAAEAGRRYAPKPPPPVTRTPSQNLPPVSSPSTPRNFLSPPANGPTTSGFGMRWHPILKRWMLHDGLDWGIPCGTPVYAAADGTIIKAGWRDSGWGNQVLIDHGIQRGVDLVTSYNHLTKIVDFGGSVKRGELIGYSGTTGYSTGCHLHFGTYADGVPVNPASWL